MDVNSALLRRVNPFTSSDFVDQRLFARSQLILRCLLGSGLKLPSHSASFDRAFSRFFLNDRIDGEHLLAVSADADLRSMLASPLILVAEDTSYFRPASGFETFDDGALRSAHDRGYVVHAASAIDPRTRLPIGWLGAHCWTRDQLIHGQNHKQRPPEDRESMKWSQLRLQVREHLEQLQYTGRIVHINDREGDCWSNFFSAQQHHHELIVRSCQNRKIEESPKKLRNYLHRQPRAFDLDLTLKQGGKTPKRQRERNSQRVVRVQVRYVSVKLQPPRHCSEEQKEAVKMTAIELYEVRPSKKKKRLHTVLLSTIEVKSDEQVRTLIEWYTARWGIEVAFDVLKNGLNVEQWPVQRVQDVRKVLAMSGPVAAQIARWVELSRSDAPPPVSEILDRNELRMLKVACRFYAVKEPEEWTIATVVEVLAKIAGASVTKKRKPGWRVVLRGWELFETFRAIRTFRERPPDHSE